MSSDFNETINQFNVGDYVNEKGKPNPVMKITSTGHEQLSFNDYNEYSNPLNIRAVITSAGKDYLFHLENFRPIRNPQENTEIREKKYPIATKTFTVINWVLGVTGSILTIYVFVKGC